MMRAREAGGRLSPAIAGSIGISTSHDPGACAPGFMLPSASRTRFAKLQNDENHYLFTGDRCLIRLNLIRPSAAHAHGNDARVLSHDAREEVSRSVRYLDLSPGD